MAILENILTGFAANVAANLLQALGSRVGEGLKSPEIQKAVERCVKDGAAALLTRMEDPTPERHHQVLDCFQEAFTHRPIAREFSKIFRDKAPDVEELALLFEDEAQWDLKNLPGLQFEDGMEAFIAAFLESALKEPRLNEIIRAEQLIQQTQVQRALLEEVRRLVPILHAIREEKGQIVGINADRIEAKNVANEIIIHQVPQVDTVAKRAESEEHHYLETLIAECDSVDLTAIDEMCGLDDTIRISDVFTTLNLTGPGRLPDENVADVLLHGSAARREPERGEKKEPIPIQAVEAIGSLPRLVVLGQPGGGKSTLVNYLTTQLALRRSNPSGFTEPLPGWPSERAPLPVRILLRRLAADLPPETEGDGPGIVWNHIRNQLAAAGCGESYEPLRHILQEEGGVIFFDGLDEVMQTDDDPKRQRVRNAVKAFSEPLGDKCRIIVTSREYAYNKSDDWRLPADRFPVVELGTFNADQIKSFVETWYTVLGPKKGLNETEANHQAAHLIDAVGTLPHLRDLAQYPLLLTLMAQVHGSAGYLPQNRADLYEKAINLLLAHWDNRLVREAGGACKLETGHLVMRLKVPLETLRASLERVAFSAHEKQEAAEYRTSGCADIPMADLLFELEEDLKSLDKAKIVVEYIHERAGLLQAQEEYRVYAFPHRTFQEYLTACHIMKQSDFNTMLSARVRRDFVWWREVFLLAAGLSRKFPVYVSSLVSTLLPKGPAASEKGMVPVEKSRHAILSGNALVETGFVKAVEKEEEGGIYAATYECIQEWLVESIASGSTLDAKQRAEAGQVLGRLGEPRLEVVTLEHMEFCLVPAGPFHMGSESYDGEKPAHLNEHLDYAFWMSKHPVTNAQFFRFVEAGGYAEERYWTEAEKAGWWKNGKVKYFQDDQFYDKPIDHGTPFNLPNHPAVGVTWHEALAFTRWLTDIWREQGIIDRRWRIRLPSEAEWEKAARGGLKVPKPAIIKEALEKAWGADATLVDSEKPERVYPWGDEIDKERTNYGETGIGSTSAMGCFSGGESPYGCLDLSGNVWEWTRSLWGKDFEKPDFGYPYVPTREREDESASAGMLRVLRGGAFYNYPVAVRCADRSRCSPDSRDSDFGFRCVCAPNTSGLWYSG